MKKNVQPTRRCYPESALAERARPLEAYRVRAALSAFFGTPASKR